MKLISLNIWGGCVGKPLLDFFEKYSQIDIFCLQEVYHNAENKISTDDKPYNLQIFSEIASSLNQHQGLFKPVVSGIYGLAMFIKENIIIVDEGEVIIHANDSYTGSGPTHQRNLQWLKLIHANGAFYIINVHGLWNGQGKGDSEARILQSKCIRSFLDELADPYILCGDFNLKPDTESLRIIADKNVNLIKLYDVQSTRTELYPKKERFADYVFTSHGVDVKNFYVMPDVVSDHAPLYIEL